MRIEIAPGIRLFFDVDGFGHAPDGPTLKEKPTLLLMHGGPGFDHASFKPLFSQLTDVAQVITYDRRGHGRSDPRPTDEWTLDTWADDVVRLCDALGIVKPIVLGQSFGGFVAQRYLARHPDHPSKVVLSSTSPAMNLARKLAVFERLGGAPARDLAERFWRTPDPDAMAQYLRELTPLYNTQPPSDPDARHRTAYRLEILLHFAAGEMQSMDLLPGLVRARCPVLVMVGEEDPVCPVQDSLDIAAALPPQWSQLERFAGAGHGVWRDLPEAGLAALRRFILA